MGSSKIKILGVPLDLGQSRRGVDMGPSAVRAAGLQSQLRTLGHQVEDTGNLAVAIPETQCAGDDRVRYLEQIAEVCKRTADSITELMDDGWTPLTLGGDHSISVGTVAGADRHFRRRKEELGLIWLDAHADMNSPETSPSGNVHGMPLACCVGLGPRALTHLLGKAPILRSSQVALVGVRNVDASEKGNVRSSGIHLFTMRDIDEQGMRKVMEQAMEIASRGAPGFHLSLDLDFVDPRDAPGVGTPSRGGATYREAHLAMEMVADSGRMRSFDVVEVNPILDTANHTATLAVELAMSAFGKRIL